MDLFQQPSVYHLGDWTIVDRGPEARDFDRYSAFYGRRTLSRVEAIDKGDAVYLGYTGCKGLIDCDGYGATPKAAVKNGESYIRETDEEFGDE